jgi:hypothetical protein
MFLLVALGAHLVVEAVDRRSPADPGTGTPASAVHRDAAAPPAPAATTPRPPVRAIGDRTLAGGALVTVRRVVDPFESTDPVITAPAGRRWVAADLEVTNLTTQVLDLTDRRQLTVRDVTDRRYDPVTTAEGLPPLDGPLAPGETRRGTVVFEVPEDAHDLRVAYAGGGETLLIAVD